MEEQMKSSKDELGKLLEQARNEMKEQFKEIAGKIYAEFQKL